MNEFEDALPRGTPDGDQDNAQRPAHFTVEYRGRPVVFTRIPEAKSEPPWTGYGYQRVEGGAFYWIDTESGTKHKLSFDAEGRATVVGSLGSTTGDGWHTVIENGVMRDV